MRLRWCRWNSGVRTVPTPPEFLNHPGSRIHPEFTSGNLGLHQLVESEVSSLSGSGSGSSTTSGLTLGPFRVMCT